MADSEADICNRALSRIGHTVFIDTLDDLADEAEICKANYAGARDQVLEDLDWSFARSRYKPSPIDATTLQLGAVPSGWGYAYALPADAIPNGIRRIVGVVRADREDEKIPFEIEWDSKLGQNIILTDEATPEFEYTVRVTDVTKFAPSFESAVAWNLAPELARALRKDESVATRMDLAYEKALGEAEASSHRAVRPDPLPRPKHIAAR